MPPRRPDYRDDELDRDDRDDGLGPPEPTFWQRYNRHLEFPTSLLMSVLAITLLFGMMVFALWLAISGGDKSSVPISLVDGGDDDSGSGSPGSGGSDQPLKTDQAPTQQDREALPLPKDLPQVREDIKQTIATEDPSANLALPDEKLDALALLDKEIRDKLLGTGRKKGSGGGPGSGDSGQAGGGPGGFGADSTRARSIRWVLRFRTQNGRDYLDQLQALGAVVMVPVENSNRQMYLFRDLANPKPGTIASDADLAQLSKQIQFSDFRRESVRQVGQALGLGYTPPVFWAFFPPGLEKELARLEVGYRNRRAEDVEETVFQVTVRGGKYELVVVEQKPKH